MQVVMKPLGEIHPYSKNAKKHDEKQIKNVAESIKQYGFVQPIVVDSDGVIVIGHCRALAAKKLGIKDVPCVCVDDLTPEQVNALRLVDNKSNESEWDFDLLKDELPELDLSAFDFDWGIPEEATQEVVEDDAPEVDEESEPITKKGNIWQLGRHRLMCGDSTDKATVEILMDGKKANLVVTDPPYNVNYEGTAGKIKNDNMDNDSFYRFLFDSFTNMEYAMADDASIYVFHSDTEGLNFRKAFADAGFYLSGCCIWKKPSLVLGRSPYQWQHEPCLFGWKKSGKHQWYAGRKETTIWEFDKPKKTAIIRR